MEQGKMKTVQIFGTGCARCQELAENARQAVARLGIECAVQAVKDLDAILRAGVMLTPALAVDGKVVAVGKVPTVEEIIRMLQEA
jgi:small redox-active disulfide protein 2